MKYAKRVFTKTGRRMKLWKMDITGDEISPPHKPRDGIFSLIC
jgi:hypothetical protein